MERLGGKLPVTVWKQMGIDGHLMKLYMRRHRLGGSCGSLKFNLNFRTGVYNGVNGQILRTNFAPCIRDFGLRIVQREIQRNLVNGKKHESRLNKSKGTRARDTKPSQTVILWDHIRTN